MCKGIILYTKEDIEKNRTFIDICREQLGRQGIELLTVILEDEEQKELMLKEDIDFAINRSRNHYIAEMLEHNGVKVFNSATVTRICNDKWKTHQFALQNNIPVMETSFGTDTLQHKYPVVIKSCRGHGGSEVFYVQNDRDKAEALKKIKGDYIVQEPANTGGRDIRVYIIGGEIVLAMCRVASDGFKSNFSLGGKAYRYELSSEETAFVEKVTDVMRFDYAGIDIIYNGNTMILNEIEDAVGARMVYENTNINIISRYARYITEFSEADSSCG